MNSQQSDKSRHMLRAVRHPGIMREIVLMDLAERLYDLAGYEAGGDGIDTECNETACIGRVTALRPMLLATVNAFFDLTDDERKGLETSHSARHEYDPYEEDAPLSDLEIARSRILSRLDGDMRSMDLNARKRLSVDLINKPEAMIRNALAVYVMEYALRLMPGANPGDWSRDDLDACATAVNDPAGFLHLLRDIRRSVR